MYIDTCALQVDYIDYIDSDKLREVSRSGFGSPRWGNRIKLSLSDI